MTSEERLLLIKQKFAKIERDKQLNKEFALTLLYNAKMTTSTFLRMNADFEFRLRRLARIYTHTD